MASSASNIDISQFRKILLKLGKERSNLVQNSSECRQKAEKGEVIVLKGNPFYAALFLIAIVGTAVTISSIFSFDIRTVIILLASTLSMGLTAFFSARSKMLVLHPEGFLYRKMIFFIFSQKWSNLTSQVQIEIYKDSEGGKWHNLIFNGNWGIKKFDIGILKIKDIKKKEIKVKFLKEIISNFYEVTNK